MRTPRILLAEDQALLLELFHRLLESEFEVVGSVADGAALVDEAVRLEPDVIVTDVSMPRMGGIEAARRLRAILPASRVVFLTVNEDPRLAAEAFRLGASAWVLKSSTSTELVHAVREAVQGRRYLTPLVAHGNVNELPAPEDTEGSVEQLTPREREVLQLLAEGKLMKEVAGVLGITARTVAFHKYRMMETLGIRSSAELIQFAVRNRVV
ncbi:MAG: response regulator transcription factor [Acidobacteria bacterium]|jgi:DNA-binding NarL/FixJ family response regulator|nr:response regulator transcription factor [Acidobacteriota bacterium]